MLRYDNFRSRKNILLDNKGVINIVKFFFKQILNNYIILNQLILSHEVQTISSPLFNNNKVLGASDRLILLPRGIVVTLSKRFLFKLSSGLSTALPV